MHHVLLSQIARALALLQHPPPLPCAHTLALRRHAFFACRRNLKVLLVFRAQVGSEATDRILLVDNAIAVRKILPGADCFAALDVLPVAPLREHLQSGGHYMRFARVRAPRTTVSPSLCCGLVMCTRIGCVNTFSESGALSARECRLPSGSGT